MTQLVRKVFGLTIALTLAFGGIANASDTNGDAYLPEYTKVNGATEVLAVISDRAGNNFTGLQREIPPKDQGPKREGWYDCAGLGDPKCDLLKADVVFQGSVLMRHCSLTQSDVCISSLELAKGTEDFKPAKFARESDQPVWPVKEDWNYPGGGGTALFQSPDVPTAGGFDSYAVSVSLKISWNKASGKFDTNAVAASVFPYRFVSDSAIRGIPGSGDPSSRVCAWTEPGGCGVLQDWAPEVRARVTFGMPKSIVGWFKGRLANPNITLASKSDKTNLVSVTGSPVWVPQLAIAKPIKEKDALLDSGLNLGWWGGPGFNQVGLGGGDQTVDRFIERYRAELKDSATGSTSMWNFATVPGGQGSKCLADSSKVLGMVTTNAMGYDGFAPSFRNGFLDYRVSGLHYQADGQTLVEGTYSLVMRSETARCLYGFSSAPISATISVVDDKGTPKVSTTSLRETKDGWLILSAQGFTFSNPVVKVKLTQARAVAKRSTITCVNLKNKSVTKKVSGLAPKCPTGFKKK